MRSAISKVNMNVIDTIAREEFGEIKRIARALSGFDTRSVFALVPLNQITWPFAGYATCFRIFFPNFLSIILFPSFRRFCR